MGENRHNAKKCIFCGKTIVGKRKLICTACLQKGCGYAEAATLFVVAEIFKVKLKNNNHTKKY